MKIVLFVILVVGVFGVSLAAGVIARRSFAPATAQPQPPTAPARGAARGELLYTIHCAKCHGDAGHGDAEGAEKLVPPPRNFASRPWRYEPSAASIERVLRQGIPGTSMPAFGATMLDADIEALSAHVLTLAVAEDAAPDVFAAAKFSALPTPRPAPKLSLAGAKGEELSLSNLQGKVVLLNFWGVSCEHCLANMPELAALQARLATRDFVVLNICADDDDAAAAQAMLSAAAPTLTAYVDPTGLANSRYEVSLMPTLWLVDRQGRLVAKAQGARQWNDPALARLIEHLLVAD